MRIKSWAQSWIIGAALVAGCEGGPSTAPTTQQNCTSGVVWTGGNAESPEMNPGMACIQCHSSNDGPRFSVAGTVYPMLHEPNLCNGIDGANSARVVITDANGQTLTLEPNSAGNFYSEGRALALPYQAKVVFMGRERMMITKQSIGDCNACHTETGMNSAPGRIWLP